MATAYENTEVSVRVASVKSLCKCLVVDKHATVAPPKVIMTCISSILIPIVKDLLESLKSITLEAPMPDDTNDASGDIATDCIITTTDQSSTDDVEDKESVSIICVTEEPPVVTSDLVEKNLDKSDDSTLEYITVVEDAFVALCQLFTLQSKRILHYPSFDKLWFQLLDVLGIILQDSTFPPYLDDIKLEEQDGGTE